MQQDIYRLLVLPAFILAFNPQKAVARLADKSASSSAFNAPHQEER